MTDGQRLYAVFAALYLVECLIWLPLGWRLFQSWSGWGSWRLDRPSGNVAFKGLGAVLSFPLPPLGGLLIPEPWPFIPNEKGLWLGENHPAAGNWLRWDDMEPLVEQRTVHLTRVVRLTAPTPRRATALARWLAQIKAAKPTQRQKLLDSWWKRSFSLPNGRADIRRHGIAAAALRWMCSLVFLLCFVWVPFIYGWFGAEDWRLPAAAGMLFLSTFLIAIAWRQLDKRFLPVDKTGRWLGFLHHFVMPQHAMRALDHLDQELLSGIHPITVAKLLLPAADWKTLASETWRYWHHLPENHPLHEAGTVLLPHLDAALLRFGASAAELDAPPLREESAASYCPRCHTSFSTAEILCQDCGGVPARPFP